MVKAELRDSTLGGCVLCGFPEPSLPLSDHRVSWIARVANCWPLSDVHGLVLSVEALKDQDGLLCSLSSALILWTPCWKD